ncbi:hypothetical protein MNBD_GAMMA04-1659 [hydrothermal vent metagenome]|uniref:SGNH hydrolase-type esterase domain-containing protein n=1 Tax=hydrothermal vent metagenome TaxID=652676 RepID=A0A3B0WHH3_9ZZZZ
MNTYPNRPLFLLHMLRPLFMVISIVLTLTGCSKTDISPLEKNAVIVAFGDSLTQGTGVSLDKSYPAVLQALTGHAVINAGVSGETTRQGLIRFSKVLEQQQPQLVILLEGGNDFLKKVPHDKIKANLARMIAIAHEKQIAVLLVGVPNKPLWGSADLYDELAEEWHIPLEEDIVPSLMRRTSMKSDYVHFNEQGYQALAEAIYSALQTSGAL